MSCQNLSNWLRIFKTEVRQIATQQFIPGETDAEALEQVQQLISAQPVRNHRQQLKDAYVLLIWNMDIGVDVIAYELQNDPNTQEFTAEDIEVLSRIQHHLHELSTSWDRQRSKWTYITLIRDMEPEVSALSRMAHRRRSRSGKGSTSTAATNYSTDKIKPTLNDSQRNYDTLAPQLEAAVKSGVLGAAQAEQLKTSIHRMHLATTQTELVMTSLRDCLASQKESIDSIHAAISKLAMSSRGEKVDWSDENSSRGFQYSESQQTAPTEKGGLFF